MPLWDRAHWYDGFIDRFDAHPVPVTVICSAGCIVATIALQEMWDSPEYHHWYNLAALLSALVLLVTLPAVVAERTKTLRSRRTTTKVIRKVNKALAESCGFPGKHVRVNIMLPNPSYHRRRVDKATAFNMDGDGDCDLEVGIAAGVSGQAWTRRKGQIGDLTIAPLVAGPDWGLTPDEQAKVRSDLKTVLSVPIFDPSESRGPLLGTLQADSIESAAELGWNELTVERAQTVADVVGLHLGFKV